MEEMGSEKQREVWQVCKTLCVCISTSSRGLNDLFPLRCQNPSNHAIALTELSRGGVTERI